MNSYPNGIIHGVTRELDTKQYLEEFLFYPPLVLLLILARRMKYIDKTFFNVSLAARSCLHCLSALATMA
jgi:hypothetical protein